MRFGAGVGGGACHSSLLALIELTWEPQPPLCPYDLEQGGLNPGSVDGFLGVRQDQIKINIYIPHIFLA